MSKRMLPAWFLAVALVPLLVAACGGGGVTGRKDLGTGPGLDVPVTELPDTGPQADTGTEERPNLPEDPGQPDVPEVEEVLPDVPDVPDVPVDTFVPCVPGKPCDDGDPCTYPDECKGGICEGKKYSCNDGRECTYNLCDGAGGCTYPVREDRCLIDGVCYKDGERRTLEDPCIACVPPVSTSSWSAADGAECDDGDFCTIGDRCISGACTGAQTNPCDDGNFCTDDACDKDKGCTHEPNTRACSDGNACTIGDVCKAGTCRAGATLVTCDDHNPCTDDRCDQDLGCVHTANTNPCNDDNLCTTGDRCINTRCQGTGIKDCADTNPCTDDTCHPKLGCQHPANTAPCSDGNACTDGDVCQFGICQPGPGLPNCNDDNPCTDDACDPTAGGCVHKPVAVETACDDGDPCTLGDFCNLGTCKTGASKVDCDDGNPCTSDLCDPLNGGACQHVNNDADCSDEDPCTLGDRCVEGLCVPGETQKVCADGNACTDDACQPGYGCVFIPNALACNDRNACTIGDHCANTACVPGDQVAACNDGNPCTTDVCKPDLGCVFDPIDGIPCDDGDYCTHDDTCHGGQCVGTDSPCDDGNPCTKDVCLPNDGGCDHVLLDTVECKPDIVITYPPRGAMILGPPDLVKVTGYVTSKGGAITEFLINEQAVPLNADGSFSYDMQPLQGTNIIRTSAKNLAGGQYKGVRAYMFAHHYYPVNPANIDAAPIPDGLQVFLGKTVWDDNDPSSLDDFASIAEALIGSFDLASMIPNPLAKQGVAWCTATIRAKNLHYGKPELDLYPVNGGLHARVRVRPLDIDIDADMSGFLCPSASGHAHADAITVDVELMITVPTPGDVKATIGSKSARVDGLDIELDGLLGFLFNWLIGLFSDQIAGMLEDQVVAMIDQLAPTIENALQSLKIDQTLTIPPLLGSGKGTDVRLKAVVSRADFDVYGGTLGLQAGAVTPKGIAYEPLGSIARGDCLGADVGKFHFIELNELEIGLFDDMLNEILYSVWYGGALEIPITEDSIPGGIDLSQYGVSNLALDISFMLPPMLTDCTWDDHLALQIGDIKIHANLVLMGQSIVMDAYASAHARAKVGVAQTATGSQLSLGIEKMESVDIEVESTNGGPSAKYALTNLLNTQLLPMIFQQLGAGLLFSFPIPEIDLGTIAPGLPAGIKFTIEPADVYRAYGYTVLSGDVK